MANTIALIKSYVSLLDEVYKKASLTSVLDSGNELARAGANTNEIVIPKLSMDGLADYSRNSGYVQGDVNLVWETVKFNYDRGRKFNIDSMDNEETDGLAFGKLASEFVRTRVVPELDAFRFATYAGTSGISKATPATYADGNAVVTALRTAINKLDEDEVPYEQRVLFITPTLLGLVQDLDTTKSKEVLKRFSQIVEVPQTRFYTAIELKDGTTAGEITGGYSKDAVAGKDINFLIVHTPAVLQHQKHVVPKVITPEQNQSNDGYLYFYRAYGLADIYENKVAGLYLSHKA